MQIPLHLISHQKYKREKYRQHQVAKCEIEEMRQWKESWKYNYTLKKLIRSLASVKHFL